MPHLLDTNCFLRLAEKKSPQRGDVISALRLLRHRNETIYYNPQVLAEFWNVCTRPANVRGGLGLPVEHTERKVKIIEKHFQLLSDNMRVFVEWRQLVLDLQVIGVQVHDARMVASMIAHNVQYLVTFNQKDFRRFSMIEALDPRDL